MKTARILSLATALLLTVALLSSCFLFSSTQSIDPSAIPEFSGNPYVAINSNVPNFTEDQITTQAYEKYSELDILGRCGVAQACCGKELMPAKDEERESISSVIPSGWVQAQYDFVDGKYLYNRCHLIGWQLTAENANEKNLITGTRYLNIEGRLPFENMIADYIKETGNHVMYRVTPIYKSNDLLPSGVQLEGYSVEDKGEGISFNVYCYNVQPGVTIDYASGRSCRAGETLPPAVGESTSPEEYNGAYVINKSSKKVHKETCSNATSISENNKEIFDGDLSELAGKGYSCCGVCLKGVTIPEASPTESTSSQTDPSPEASEPLQSSYMLNTGSKKIHLPTCQYAKNLSNIFTGNVDSLIEDGYTKCKICLKE